MFENSKMLNYKLQDIDSEMLTPPLPSLYVLSRNSASRSKIPSYYWHGDYCGKTQMCLFQGIPTSHPGQQHRKHDISTPVWRTLSPIPGVSVDELGLARMPIHRSSLYFGFGSPRIHYQIHYHISATVCVALVHIENWLYANI